MIFLTDDGYEPQDRLPTPLTCALTLLGWMALGWAACWAVILVLS